jgi:nitroreductase
MDFRELVLTRRTVHNYHSEAVPDSLVEDALKLSLWAPNHKLTYPWVYTLVGRGAREKLADLGVELKGVKGGEALSAEKAKAVRDSVLNPSHLVSLALKRSVKPGQEHEDYATLACSVQIMSLFLWQSGVATKWSTGAWSMHEKTYPILGLDATQVRLEGVLMIGKAQHLPSAPERPELSKFLRRV